MKTYIALDVSQTDTHLCAVDEGKNVLWETRCFTSPTSIYDTIQRKTTEPTLVGLETGSLSPWLYHELKELGLPVVVMDAADANARMGRQRRVKNDRRDARGLAELLRADMHKEVHVKSYENHRIRGAIGARAQLVRTLVDVKNQIRGLLKVEGTRLTRKQVTNLKESVAPSQFEQDSIRVLNEVAAYVSAKVNELERSLTKQAEQHEGASLLMTIPGVGPVTALTFATTMDDPTRFQKSRNVGPYLGLTPKIYQSGNTEIIGRCSKQGDKYLRSCLYQAACVLLVRTNRTSPLQDWGRRLRARTGFKKACIAVARKLAVMMHRMLITGEEYRPSAAAAVPAAT